MNLKGVKSVVDKGDHFVVTHEESGVTRVPKSLLSKKAHAQVLELAKKAAANTEPQADGAIHADTGTMVPEEGTNSVLAPEAPAAPPIDPAAVDSALSSAALPTVTPPAEPAPVMLNGTEVPGAVNPTPGSVASQLSDLRSGKAPAGLDVSGIPDTAPRGPTPQGTPQAPAVVPPAGHGGPTPQGKGRAPKGGAQDGVQPLPDMRQFDNGVKDEEDAIRAKAEAEGNAQHELSKAQNEYNNEQQMKLTTFNDASAKLQAKQAADLEAYRSAGVDDKRYWSNHSKGQAAVAIILGGLTFGVDQKQDNPALKIVQDGIAQDIDDQKQEIAKKYATVGLDAAQVHQLNAQFDIEKANRMEAFAGKLAAEAARTGSQAAQLNANAAIAKLHQDSMQLRQKVLKEAIDLQHAPVENALNDRLKRAQIGAAGNAAAASAQERKLRDIQITQAQQGVDQGKRQAEFDAQVMGAPGGAPAAGGGDEFGGGGFDPRYLNSPLMAKYKDQAVRVGDGLKLAITPDDAKEIKKVQDELLPLQAKMRRYEELRKMHPNGIWDTSLGGNPGDYAEAQRLRKGITTDIGAINGNKRLSEVDLGVYNDEVPDITSTSFNAEKNQRSIESIRKELAAKIGSVYQSRLVNPFGKGL